MNKWGLISLIFTIFLFSNFFISLNVEACKDIVACGDATGGDYNLLLKVRDPSRPGLQVLCIVTEGYGYTYHRPWTGKPMSFKTTHKYIGVASKGDTIPNIVKAGMSLSDAGISYGDADTNSNWINPTKHAWDDFDWIRYACEKAGSEDEAVSLITEDVVKKMHATGVSENLFVVGPKKGVVIEADAFRYKVKEIYNGVVVMSNYPKELWKTQIREKLPIARSFDTVVEKYIRNRGVVRLKSLYGIRVIEIGDDSVTVKPVSPIRALKTGNIGIVTKIGLGERKTVGSYSVELLDIEGKKAKISVSYFFKAWEDRMIKHIQSRYGSITVKDMINWSRLHREDLDGLRPMCEGVKYEAVAIYKVPKKNYDIISSGWFAANRACSSIYVPFHICDTDIYDPYETGEAAELSLQLLNQYGHDTLTNNFSKVEDVFLYETEEMEEIATELIAYDPKVVSDFLTVVDMGMQRQALLTEEIWMEASKTATEKIRQEILDIIDDIWGENYPTSLSKMKNLLLDIKQIVGLKFYRDKVEDIALDICRSKIDASKAIGKQSQTAEEDYKSGRKLIKQGEYESGFEFIEKAFTECDMLMKGESTIELTKENTEKNENKVIFPFVLVIFLTLLFLMCYFIFLRKKYD